MKYSLVIPVYKNEMNIDDLLAAIRDNFGAYGAEFETVFVVDGSPDKSWQLLHDALPNQPFASRLIALSRNFGSFAAIRAGIEFAQGDFIACMAADLQEPPELVQEFYQELERGECDVVFGARSSRNDPAFSHIFSSIYWALYKKFVIPDIPKGGVDIFACNKTVRDSIISLTEQNTSFIAQLYWVGYKRKVVFYERRERLKGKSAWTFRKKLSYLLNSIFSITDLPLRILMWTGVLGIIFSFAFSAYLLAAKYLGWLNVPGYATILIVVMMFGSFLIFTQGIIGYYLWRAVENTKNRPVTLIMSDNHFPAQ